MGAILYLLVTGNEPPEATTTSAFANTIHAAKTASGQPIPEEIRTILHKSLNRHRFSVGALHGDMAQTVRFATLEKFRAGELQLLVCSRFSSAIETAS